MREHRKIITVLLFATTLIFVSVISYLAYQRSHTLDFRSFFPLGNKSPKDNILIAEKPPYPVAGNIYFLHPNTPHADWDLMRFDCANWKLESLGRLPAEFDNTDVFIDYADPTGEEFYFILASQANGKQGVTRHSFYSFKLSSRQWEKYTTRANLYRVQRLENFVYCMVVPENSKHAAAIDRLDLQTGSIVENCFHSGDSQSSFGGMMSDDKIPETLYFSEEIEGDRTLATRIYRLDNPCAEPLPVETYPPGRIAGPANRIPFPVGWGDNNTKPNRFHLFMNRIGLSTCDSGQYELWVGTMPVWDLKKCPTDLYHMTMNCDSILERKKLIKVPYSDFLRSDPLLVSPDGKYVLFRQNCRKPIQAERLIAVNMETGKKLPILMNLSDDGTDFFSVHWKSDMKKMEKNSE
ncbi:MAG TPA: hypothetical protein PLA90_16680 [Candidatus Sumerlaeota bacterium]|nr:hypothetical protein [Candidatus Sumerlaeota bacterium]